MVQGYRRSRFEIFVVASVIGFIALVAIDRYSLMIRDSRVLRLEIISHHFMTAAVNMRVQFLVSQLNAPLPQMGHGVLIDRQFIYFSEQGWPLSVSPVMDSTFQPSDEDCYLLWNIFLQNPAAITRGEFTKITQDYRTFARQDSCRYSLEKGKAYFDYYLLSGRLIFSPINR